MQLVSRYQCHSVLATFILKHVVHPRLTATHTPLQVYEY